MLLLYLFVHLRQVKMSTDKRYKDIICKNSALKYLKWQEVFIKHICMDVDFKYPKWEKSAQVWNRVRGWGRKSEHELTCIKLWKKLLHPTLMAESHQVFFSNGDCLRMCSPPVFLCVCLHFVNSHWIQHSPHTLVLSLSLFCYVHEIKCLYSPAPVNITAHKHPTVELSTTNCCCSQVDIQEWRWIYFLIPKVMHNL